MCLAVESAETREIERARNGLLSVDVLLEAPALLLQHLHRSDSKANFT